MPTDIRVGNVRQQAGQERERVGQHDLIHAAEQIRQLTAQIVEQPWQHVLGAAPLQHFQGHASRQLPGAAPADDTQSRCQAMGAQTACDLSRTHVHAPQKCHMIPFRLHVMQASTKLHVSSPSVNRAIVKSIYISESYENLLMLLYDECAMHEAPICEAQMSQRTFRCAHNSEKQLEEAARVVFKTKMNGDIN